MGKKKPADEFEYDVALSFAGEDRAHAEKLATLLRRHNVRVFYDEFQRATLWGKDLYQHLETIYKDRARYCVVFVSKNYIKKNWTKHELKHAQARSFSDDREYILPLRVDETALPGLAATIGYIDVRTTPIEEVAALLLQKLGHKDSGLTENDARAKWEGDFVEYNGAQVASFWPERLEAAQHQPIALITHPVARLRFGEESSFKGKGRKPPSPCHDCAALIGQFHVSGCDMEECPVCGGQQIGCGCRFKAVTEDEVRAWEEDEEYDDQT
jgi:hypothetical protein